MSALSLFRSELQLRLLGLLLASPEKEWTARELTERLGATTVTVHRELHRALAAGLLLREPIGRTYRYRADTDSPLHEPLRLLLERTVGIEAQLRRALADVAGVEAAFIHGSFATQTAVTSTSDVDLVVLGHVDPRALRKRIRSVEGRLGREIDLLAYTTDEFDALARKGNSLVRGILAGPKLSLVGSDDALAIV